MADQQSKAERSVGTQQAELRRPRPLPGGRAAVGALLVVAAVFGVFAVTAGADDTPSNRYVVVTGPVDLGSTLTQDMLRLEPIDLPPSTATTAFTSIDAVLGAVTLAPLAGGELLGRSSVLLPSVTATDGARADGTDSAGIEFSFGIERDHAVDGALQSGELVDVLATYTSAGEGYTDIVTRAATVTSVGDQHSDTIAAPGTIVITLALAHDEDVLALAHAKETAAVTLVRTTRTGDAALPDRYRPDPRESGGSGG